MLPTLKALADGAETPLSDVRARVAAAEELTPEDLGELLPSGHQTVFANRVSWALTGMGIAGLVEKVRPGCWRLTEEGERLLAQAPSRIDRELLLGYPAYKAYVLQRKTRRRNRRSPNQGTGSAPLRGADTPEEALDRAAGQLNDALKAEVLKRVRDAAPAFLERVVMDLLIAMGYGGGDAAMGWVTGGPGDGGIDGKIREDKLGLDEVYLQAKKYAAGNTVGESALRNFAGALDAAGTSKGVFVSTSDFTNAARDYVARSPKRIVLIDGEELARLMVTHDIGVRRKLRYEVKQIDEDYFGLEDL